MTILLVKDMFDLQIDKKKKQKLSSMNKSCEKKNQQHIVKIFYMWMFCITLKERNTKRYYYFLFIIFLIQISYCPSIYYLKTKINPKQ
jgi:hypothetical protein